jgi:aspartate-semialdehyde dehydrogenase
LPEVERATGSSGRAIRQQGTPNNKRPVLHNDNTPHKMINLALVGATGLVGQMMVKVLEEQKIPVAGFYPAASERSVGKKAHLNGKEYKVCSIAEAVDARPDIALFSAGGDVSREWAGKFAANGTYVIDNSSAWRMDPKVPLVVPEVNPHAIGIRNQGLSPTQTAARSSWWWFCPRCTNGMGLKGWLYPLTSR